MRGVVASVSGRDLTVRLQGSVTPAPARLPLYPTITVAVGAMVLLTRDEGQLVVIARTA